MSIDPLSDAKVLDSWHKNAAPWTRAIQRDEIASRTLVTNRAIVDAVLARRPKSVLDVGCGEGWLVRALAAHGIRATGVDAVPELIAAAQRGGGGEFLVASYEAFGSGTVELGPVDVAVANFSLIGHEAVDALVRRVPALLAKDGAFIVQTLHPHVACGDLPYRDGWRPGSWAGFRDDGFTDPAPWYFRTLESWVHLFVTSGLRLVEMQEPFHPTTGKPASVILVATGY